MTFHDITVKSIDGREVSLGDYQGKYCLVVNVASECGLTPQYAGLEDLYREFQDKNLVVLGFPCNQFLSQEPGSNEEICQFARERYDVTFPLFEKIEVNGDEACELYKYLTSEKTNSQGQPDIAWNFTKFLVDADGKVVERFEPRVTPEQIKGKLEFL